MEPEYIKREAAMQAARHAWGKGLEPSQYIEIIPTADVAPVSELLALRDTLYENDKITMRGLARLNVLIAKYGGYDNG